MRRPSLGQHDGDLSRLTSASSPAESSLAPSHQTQNTTPDEIKSTYLPEIIEPLEWQQTRKRKERQDSTSSITQDRKLVRSNSEECIPAVGNDVIRRVSSHEDFKKPNTPEPPPSSSSSSSPSPPALSTHLPPPSSIENNDIDDHPVAENNKIVDLSSKSNRMSPNRDMRLTNKKDGDCSDGENERRRSSERFSRTRAPPGRKAPSPRKPSKHVMAKMRERDENVYKYDISSLKYERRGFISRDKQKQPQQKLEVVVNETVVPLSDYNENNLIDLNGENIDNDCPLAPTKSPNVKSTKEILPWKIPFQEDTPVVCPRFADNNFEYVNNSSDKFIKIRNVPSLNDMKSYGKFASIENLKTRDIMKKIPPQNIILTSDERVKQINSRLSKLKKRVAQFEENFIKDNGYKPPLQETLNDRAMKNIVAEIHKLKKEKQNIKSDPLSLTSGTTGCGATPGVGGNACKTSSNSEMNGDMKLNQMQEILTDIEMVLKEKRKEEERSSTLEELSVDQLMQEKVAVQRGLLYLESVIGRPNSRDERNLARPLYDRYRLIKRMVNRTSSLSGSGVGIPELPTILEHEAMAFTATTTPSTDITPPSVPSVVESPSEAVESSKSTDSTDDTSSSINENVHTLAINELWQQLDLVREEKRQLRRTIKDFEHKFEKDNGRKMLKSDRKGLEDTYALYKNKKGRLRLLDALVKKHMAY